MILYVIFVTFKFNILNVTSYISTFNFNIVTYYLIIFSLKVNNLDYVANFLLRDS